MANGATKALRVMDNLERILAIELMNASQAIEYRRPLQCIYRNVFELYRGGIVCKEDRILHYDIEKPFRFE
jgi:histidine ammonia-lyase